MHRDIVCFYFPFLYMTGTSTSCCLAGLLGEIELGAQGILFQLNAVPSYVNIVYTIIVM